MAKHKLIYTILMLCIIYQQSQAVPGQDGPKPDDSDQAKPEGVSDQDVPEISQRTGAVGAWFVKKFLWLATLPSRMKRPSKNDNPTDTEPEEIPFEVTMSPFSTDYAGRRKNWVFRLPHIRYEQVILIPRKCDNCRYQSVKLVPDADYLASNELFREFYGKCIFNVLVPEGKDIDPSDYDYVNIDRQVNYDYAELMKSYPTSNWKTLCDVCENDH